MTVDHHDLDVVNPKNETSRALTVWSIGPTPRCWRLCPACRTDSSLAGWASLLNESIN